MSGLTAVQEPDLMGSRLPVIWRASRDTQFHGVPSLWELCAILSPQEDVQQNHTCGCRMTYLTTETRPRRALMKLPENLMRVIALSLQQAAGRQVARRHLHQEHGARSCR